MATLLVTGASGNLGDAVLRHLVQIVPPEQVAGLVRDKGKACRASALGIELREGDYSDYDSLVRAFDGIEKIYLVSAVAFTDRVAQHRNVIKAAQQSGVKHIIYPSIQRFTDEMQPIDWVTESDISTEKLLKESGVDYTIVYHPLYAEALPQFLGQQAATKGFKVPYGNGRIPYASFEELGEAGAILLSQFGHENSSYTLNSGTAWAFDDIANELSKLSGSLVEFQELHVDHYISTRENEGWPLEVAKFTSQWLVAIQNGSFQKTSRSLERILGRKPKSLNQIIADGFLA